MAPVPTDEEILASVETCDQINELQGLPSVKGKNYVIVGGSGSMGSCLVDILIRAGAESIRVIDIMSPTIQHAKVQFVKTDMTDANQVEAAFNLPFPLPDAPIVCHHVAALIAFWARLSYNRQASFDVNLQGTKNIIRAMQRLSAPGGKYLIYTSSAAVKLPRPNFARITKGKNPLISDEINYDTSVLNTNHYNVSKRMAQEEVLKANGMDGIYTAVLQPGMAVVGPRDVFIAGYLAAKVNPVWGTSIAQASICARDGARAHIFCENALIERPGEIGGDAFLVTGDQKVWQFKTFQRAAQLLSGRDLHFKQVSAAFMFIMAHIFEFILWFRYVWLTTVLHRQHVAETPAWAHQVRLLQPATLDTANFDVVIDDSRARKVLGYFPVWSTMHSVVWTVKTVEEKRKTHEPLGPMSAVGGEVTEETMDVNLVQLKRA